MTMGMRLKSYFVHNFNEELEARELHRVVNTGKSMVAKQHGTWKWHLEKGKTSSEIKLPCLVVWVGPELGFWRHFPGKNQPSVSWDQTLLDKVIRHHVFWIQPIIEVWFDQPIIPLHVFLWKLAFQERTILRLELVILNSGLPFKKKTVDSWLHSNCWHNFVWNVSNHWSKRQSHNFNTFQVKQCEICKWPCKFA